MYGDVVWQIVRADLQSNDVYLLAVLGKLYNPPMKEPEDRMFDIDYLSDDEQFHGSIR
jgi:hypothetical protein